MGEVTVNSWNTSVTELLSIFRGALLALIPWLEKAKIRWKDEEAYDDWDNMAESIYENIVCSSLNSEVASEHTIAKYNFRYDDYELLDFIGVRTEYNSGEKFAFVAFQSTSSPLDSVILAEIDETYKVIRYTNLMFDGLTFFFRKKISGESHTIYNIEVLL